MGEDAEDRSAVTRAGLVAIAGAACLTAVGGLSACSPSQAPARPNIVLVIGDDHGYPDSGFMGSPHVETPNLDRLAAEGSVFTRAYNTASVCEPSLRTYLTGFYPQQYSGAVLALISRGVWYDEMRWLGEMRPLPRLLGEHGYASFQAGKYWEEDYTVAGFTDGMVKPGDMMRNRRFGRKLGRELSIDVVTEFVDAHADGPFFLWFAPMLPHTPFDAPQEFLDRYEGRGFSRGAMLYYANVTRLDHVVGQLLRHLEAAGLRERTLVVYLSDNGWDQEPETPTPGFMAGPRGKKTMYELGFRTPLVFSWPGVVPEGVVHDALVSTVDLYPTLLDYAGVEVPQTRFGLSLRPTLEEGAAWPRKLVIGSVQHPRVELGAAKGKRPGGRSYFLTDGDWWYIWYQGLGVQELFDLRSDPRSLHDVAGEHPERVHAFQAAVRHWEGTLRTGRPDPPVVGPVQSPASGQTR